MSVSCWLNRLFSCSLSFNVLRVLLSSSLRDWAWLLNVTNSRSFFISSCWLISIKQSRGGSQNFSHLDDPTTSEMTQRQMTDSHRFWRFLLRYVVSCFTPLFTVVTVTWKIYRKRANEISIYICMIDARPPDEILKTHGYLCKERAILH